MGAQVARQPGEPDATLARCLTLRATSSPNRLAKGRRPRAAPGGGPASTITPSSSTTARSASETVESRCVAISTVRPASAGRRRVDEVSLGLRVDGRERVVEHEHAGACDQRAGERDALPLAAGEVDAALADQRVVAVGQVGDEVGHAGGLAGREHLVPRCVGPRGGEVVAQRHREQDRPLRHERDRGAQLSSLTSRRSTPPSARSRRSGRRSAGAG